MFSNYFNYSNFSRYTSLLKKSLGTLRILIDYFEGIFTFSADPLGNMIIINNSNNKPKDFELKQAINNPTPAGNDYFGYSTSIYQDTLVVGAYGNDFGATDAGSAYVYVRVDSIWTLQQTINNPSSTANDFFGRPVSLHQDTLVIGAWGDDAGASGAGSVYIYVRADSTWTLQQKINNPTPAGNDYFGYSISIYQDTLVVGVREDDTGASNAGSVYVYIRTNGVWTLQQEINNPIPTPSDFFGGSVSLYQDTFLVSISGDDTGTSGAGSVYVYTRTNGVWTLQQEINNPGPAVDDWFGWPSTLNLDTLVIAALNDDTGSSNSGSVYVYTRTNGVWTLQQEINNPGPAGIDWFGSSISLYQDILAVGAYNDDTGASNAGSVYVYKRAGSTWTLQQEINNPAPAANDYFSISISLCQDTLVVGAHNDDTGASNAGSVYVYNFESKKYNAQTKAGRALKLGTTNGLDIPIFYTASAETKQAATLGTGWTANGNHRYTGSNTSNNLSNISTLTLTGSMVLEINFEIVARTAGTVEGKSVLGNYKVYKTSEILVGSSFSGTVIINSVKQITNPNSFLTYHNIGTNTMVHLGDGLDSTGNSPELVVNGTFDKDVSGWLANGAGLCTFYALNGFLEIENAYTNGLNKGRPYQIVPTVIGKTYVFEYFITQNIGTYSVFVGTAIQSSAYYSISQNTVPFTVKKLFIAASTTTYITLWTSNNTGTAKTSFDNISIKEVLSQTPIYSLIDKTVNNILTTHSEFNSNDLIKIQANPNLLAKLAMNGSTEELDMVLVGDEGWYPCSENSGRYVVNARGVKGIDISLEQPIFEVGSSNVAVSVEGTIIKLTGTTATNSARYAYSRLSTNIPSMLDSIPAKDKYYLFDFLGRVSHESVNGKPFAAWGGTSVIVYPFTIQQNVWQRYLFISKSTGNKDDWFGMFENTNTIGASVELDAATLTVQEIEAADIKNYIETIRTNVDFNTVGLQTLCLEFDSLGVPQSYTETVLKHNAKQEILFPLVPAYTYTTTKDIADISGDNTSLTITYTDATSVTIP